MAPYAITCPKCSQSFELDAVLTQPLREELSKQLQTELRAQVEAEFQGRLQERDEALDTAKQQLKQSKERELALARQERELEEQRGQQELEMERFRAEERRRLREQQETLIQERVESALEERLDAQQQALEQAQRESERLRQQVDRQKTELCEEYEEQLKAQREEIETARKDRLEMLKQQQALADKEAKLELRVQEQLASERKKLLEEAQKDNELRHNIEVKQHQETIERLNRRLGEMQQQLEQGSQVGQGKAFEGDFFEVLQKSFPHDEVEQIKVGARGADILHRVCTRGGRPCGSILWEIKNTRNWSPQWIPKLKEDQRNAGADMAVILTMALPGDIEHFGHLPEDNVWVTDYFSAVALCCALRETVTAVARERTSNEHRGTLKDVVYEFVTGPQFREFVNDYARRQRDMLEDLEKEKRAFTRIWSKREQQIRGAETQLAQLYGQLQGLVQDRRVLPDVEGLALPLDEE